jgi:hypothetical protein
MSYDTEDQLPWNAEEWEAIQFIERTTEWMTKFLDAFKMHRRAKQFPENLYADQNISMVEDMANQIAIKAAEIQAARKPKE